MSSDSWELGAGRQLSSSYGAQVQVSLLNEQLVQVEIEVGLQLAGAEKNVSSGVVMTPAADVLGVAVDVTKVVEDIVAAVQSLYAFLEGCRKADVS